MTDLPPTLVDSECLEELIFPSITELPLPFKLVELGSFLGGSIIRITKWIIENKTEHIPSLCLIYAIDNWKCENISPESKQWAECTENFETNFLNNLTKCNLLDKIAPLKKDSVIAAKCFSDKSIDLLFVDDNHLYPGTKNVLEAWKPKITDNGFIIGHDYSDAPGVRLAVQEVLGEDIKLTSTGSAYLWKNKCESSLV